MDKMRLFLLGFLTLFLELALIRYLPSNIWNLGYFPNLVLIGVFVGMGIGFVFHHHFRQEKSEAVFRRVPIFLSIFILTLIALRPDIPGFQEGMGKVGNEIFFTSTMSDAPPSQIWSSLLFVLWFGSIVTLFAMISQYTAKYFAKFDPLTSYTLDIFGSCMGIVTFMLISWFQLPASIWFLICLPLFYFTAHYQTPRQKWIGIAAILVTVITVTTQDSRLFQELRGFKEIGEFVWSPYQRVKYRASSIYVNSIPHQTIVQPQELPNTFYSIPYKERAKHPELPPYKNILVIGAGSGNDVMTALQNDVAHVDAVEIDPAISGFGEKYNPGKPYSDPRVSVIVNDGRAHMTKTDKKYDLIILALTDSLVKVSPMAQLRLENFLFTRETVQRARELLNPGGTLVFYNYYRTQWLIEKLQALLSNGFDGKMPETYTMDGNFAVMLVNKDMKEIVSPRQLSPSTATLELPTDNWPFLYLQTRSIPSMYLIAMGCLTMFILFMLFLLERAENKNKTRSAPHDIFIKTAFVLMGIAFLLLETKSVIQFSLLFGTTWVNSSLVFLSILILVLAANWTAWLIKNDSLIYVAFALLMASCAISLYYPISNLLYFEDRTLRFIFASLLTFSPIFFANLIFSLSFRNQPVAEHLFGWNLIGATLGGVLEYWSMVVGYHSLTLLVAGCYLLAFLMLVAARVRLPRTLSTEGVASFAKS